jgi:hypothetical protein
VLFGAAGWLAIRRGKDVDVGSGMDQVVDGEPPGWAPPEDQGDPEQRSLVTGSCLILLGLGLIGWGIVVCTR